MNSHDPQGLGPIGTGRRGGQEPPLPPLMEAKFRPTRYRVAQLDRSVLVNRVHPATHTQLTVVQSPAGYGKTTLLTQWHDRLARSAGSVAVWLTLDREEREPTAFVSCLALALSRQGLVGTAVARAASANTPGVMPDQVLRSVLLELGKTSRRVVVFLDDYHVVECPDIDLLVGDLLRNAPACLHLAIATRNRPNLPLATLRSRGVLQELGPQDLRFTAEEIAHFLGADFAADASALIAQRTEGWPVALQIARIWIDDRADAGRLMAAFSGSTEEMAAYMVEQVMSRLAPETRNFLIDTSILRRVNGDVANAICGRSDGWQQLEEVERFSALIVPVDSGRTWYRHHQLFAEFLRAQLARKGEHVIAALHRRASDWFAAHGEIAEAVEHARAAGERERALSLLDEAGLLYRMLRDGADLYRSFKVLFTPDALQAYPRVAIAQVLLWIKEGELREARVLLDQISAKLESGAYADDRFRCEQLSAEVLVMASFLSNYIDGGVPAETVQAMEAFVGRIDRQDHWYRALLQNLICTMHFHRGNLLNAGAAAHLSIDHFSLAGLQYGQFFVELHLGSLRLFRGDLLAAEENIRRAERIVEESFPFDRNMAALCRIYAAELHYEGNRLESAAEHCWEALREVEEADGWVEVYLSGYRTALGLAFARQGMAGMGAVLERGRRFARRRDLPRLAWFLRAREVQAMVVSGQLDEARIGLKECERGLAELTQRFDHVQTWRERHEYAVLRARLLIARNLPVRAIELVEGLMNECEEMGHGWRIIQASLLMALAHRAAGSIEEAARYLRQAMQLSREGRFVRVFIDEGAPLEALLKSVIAHVGITSLSAATLDWATELLAAFGAEHADPQKSLVGHVFTEREQDVLRSLKVGKSNKVIARELSITDNAVKFHLKNIFRKLGVNDRRLALVAAEKRGLLS